jgi:uncharacterized coiled-coil DUF342 family protein|tara:strand:- start:2151 stop:2504 length:354 start_codon:yes stop_codon:yes gene_type:complete
MKREEREENKQLRNKVGELKSECAVLAERIDEMKAAAFADANTINHLKEKYDEAKTNMALMTDENVELEERNDELNAHIVEQTGREAALEREVSRLKSALEDICETLNKLGYVHNRK